VLISAGFEVYANILLAKSEGFTRHSYAFRALVFVALAFTLLTYAVRGMDLSVAYALWGGFGILGTGVGGWLLFGQRLKPIAWLGMLMLLAGIVMLQLF
jgi:spermidine export protein MdtI